MVWSISSPFSKPGPLYEFMEERLALSKDDLNTKLISSSFVISFKPFAVSSRISMLSAAQGPARIVNLSPPILKFFNSSFFIISITLLY